MERKEIGFGRDDTRIVKAVAVIMMLAHHIFAFPERLPAGYSYTLRLLNQDDFVSLAYNLKLCVPIFMFLGGYGLYKQWESGHNSFFKYIRRQYVQYWKIFAVFVPIGFIFFSAQADYCTDTVLCHVFENFKISQFISNLIGETCEYNREWWFLKAYLCAGIVGYSYICITKKRNGQAGGFWPEVLTIACIAGIWPEFLEGLTKLDAFTGMRRNFIFVNLVAPERSTYSFLMGIVFARHDAIRKMRIGLHGFRAGIRWGICLCSVAAIIIARAYLFAEYIDIFLTPLFVVCCLELCTTLPTRGKIMNFVGKYSGDMWLIHGFYCYYFWKVMKIIFVSHEPSITLAIFVPLTLGSAIVIELFYKWGGMLMNRIKLIKR